MGNRGLGIVLICAGTLIAGCDDPYPYVGNGDDAPDADPRDAEPRPDGFGPDGMPGPDAESNDGMGPMFTLVTPLVGEMIAGELHLVVDITDVDGVAQASVVATIAGTHTIDMTHTSADRYEGVFDTVTLAGLVFPTIIVRAKDVAGNLGQLGFEIVLDNEAPIASMDPPRVREAEQTADGLACSYSFDPVGSDAANDGTRILQLTALRARVQDSGNTGTMTTPVYIPHAGVASVELYVLDDTTRPLVVDADGNGSCDAINPEITPSTVPSASNEAAVIDLVGLNPSGSTFYAGDLGGDPFVGSNAASCITGTETDQPPQLCAFAAASRIPELPMFHEPLIYSIPPVNELACMGYGFDALATNIADGWACAAVRVTDNLGNVRVSAPLRVCVDSNNDQSSPCLLVPISMPNCTGTYVGATDTVNNTPCTPRAIPLPAAGDYELLRTDF